MGYYRKARNYESFIRKVYNCEKGKKNGANESFMMDLFLNEFNTDYLKNQRTPPSRQFFKVKMYVQKALIILRKRKKYTNSDKHFMPLLLRLQEATCVHDLSVIVNATMVKMIMLENNLRRAS